MRRLFGVFLLAFALSACGGAGRGTPKESGTRVTSPSPILDKAAREAVVAAAFDAVHKHMISESRDKSDEIAPDLWGEAIERLRPIRVLDDLVNVFIVLKEDATSEEGFYVEVPISSHAPGHDARFLLFEKMSEPDDKSFGEIYRCTMAKPKTQRKEQREP